MLREIKDVKQERGASRSPQVAAGHRRWFESDDLDLIVWLNREAAVIGFQLCYDAGRGEHALTWREGLGFEHSRIDSGDDMRPFKGTPVLEPDGAVPWTDVISRFEDHSGTLDAGLRGFIARRLHAHG